MEQVNTKPRLDNKTPKDSDRTKKDPLPIECSHSRGRNTQASVASKQVETYIGDFVDEHPKEAVSERESIDYSIGNPVAQTVQNGTTARG